MMIVDWMELKRLGLEPVPYEMIEDGEGELAADELEVARRWCHGYLIVPSAWRKGYRAGFRGESDIPPARVRASYGWQSWHYGYMVGRRKAGRYPLLIPMPSWTKH